MKCQDNDNKCPGSNIVMFKRLNVANREYLKWLLLNTVQKMISHKAKHIHGYTLQFKLSVVAYAELQMNRAATRKEFVSGGKVNHNNYQLNLQVKRERDDKD